MERAARWRQVWRSETRATSPSFPLTITFGVASFVLTLILGLVLSGQIKSEVTNRSTTSLATTTRIATVITVHAIVSGLTSDSSDLPLSQNEKIAQTNTISSAAHVLVDNSGVVSVSAVLADGTIIGGASGPPVGSLITRTASFSSALKGVTQVRTLQPGKSGMSLFEGRLVGKYGTILLVQEGVRLFAGGPIVGVVSTYTPLAMTNGQATSEIRSSLEFLGVGLLIFWAALFRLVARASRALRRQSRLAAHQATHDALTGLPNRLLLRDRTERAMRASRHSGSNVALILMDLDRFKEINDTLGHPQGDLVLQQIGPRLQSLLRGSDTVARVGGDEFVVMLPEARSSEEAVAVAEKLVLAFQQPFLLGNTMVDIGCSSGVASTPGHGADFDDLMRHADMAMYAAKRDGSEVLAYDPTLDTNDSTRLGLLADLRLAIANPEQIHLHYQPQADLRTGRISGAEVLVRWQHPTRGLIFPDDFIPLAEQSGIIRQLTWCILRQALTQIRQWVERDLLTQVSVNISTRSLLEAGFVDGVVRLLAETGVAPEHLELELTETAIMTDPQRAMAVLGSLADHGIRLSIDDFGTGYSSLAYLKDLPVSEMKIDRTFVADMEANEGSCAIVRSCLELARNLHLGVVAEGVETVEVWDHLTELGCPTAQGYYLSRPLPAAAFTSWMTLRRGVPSSRWDEAVESSGKTSRGLAGAQWSAS